MFVRNIMARERGRRKRRERESAKQICYRLLSYYPWRTRRLSPRGNSPFALFASFRARRCGRTYGAASSWGTRAWCCSGWGGTRAGRTTASPPTRRAAPTPTHSSSTYDVSECACSVARRDSERDEAAAAVKPHLQNWGGRRRRERDGGERFDHGAVGMHCGMNSRMESLR